MEINEFLNICWILILNDEADGNPQALPLLAACTDSTCQASMLTPLVVQGCASDASQMTASAIRQQRPPRYATIPSHALQKHM